MTHYPTVGSSALMLWLEKALAVLLLAMLVHGHPVFAQTTTGEASAEAEVAQSEPPVSQHTVQEVLLHVCEENGYGEACAKTLLGMVWTESSNRSSVIGDNGRARGYFQIHYKLHKISIACAEDLVCSANWTIKYLERNQYPKYVNYAVQCHNSCNVNNGYVGKVTRYGNQFWNQPLAVTQTAPIELAVSDR